MRHTKSAFIRMLSLLLLFSMTVTVLTGCKKKGNDAPPSTSGNTDVPPIKGDDMMYTSSNYVKKYADTEAMKQWLQVNILNRDVPPVTFTVMGKSSLDLAWEKSVGRAEKVVYFEKEANPSQSTKQVINYRCKELSIRIEFTLITYTDYPVVEYTAVLYNEADGNSKRLSDLLAADYIIENNSDVDALQEQLNLLKDNYKSEEELLIYRYRDRRLKEQANP